MAVGKSDDGPIATKPGAKGQRSQAELERIAAGVVVSGVQLWIVTLQAFQAYLLLCPLGGPDVQGIWWLS